jgi:hypothetical protein
MDEVLPDGFAVHYDGIRKSVGETQKSLFGRRPKLAMRSLACHDHMPAKCSRSDTEEVQRRVEAVRERNPVLPHVPAEVRDLGPCSR